jgi:hypothetical protein
MTSHGRTNIYLNILVCVLIPPLRSWNISLCLGWLVGWWFLDQLESSSLGTKQGIFQWGAHSYAIDAISYLTLKFSTSLSGEESRFQTCAHCRLIFLRTIPWVWPKFSLQTYYYYCSADQSFSSVIYCLIVQSLFYYSLRSMLLVPK